MIKIKIESDNAEELKKATNAVELHIPLGVKVELEVVNTNPAKNDYSSFNLGYTTKFVNQLLAVGGPEKIALAGWNSKEEMQNDKFFLDLVASGYYTDLVYQVGAVAF